MEKNAAKQAVIRGAQLSELLYNDTEYGFLIGCILYGWGKRYYYSSRICCHF